MKLHTKLVTISAVLALGAAPALALADAPSHPTGPPSFVTTGKSADAASHKPATPGPKASLPAKAKAYGTYCKSESRKHVSGQKGTPFSQCVTAMAKLATGKTSHPHAACKSESKKHVSGEKGTPFSRCVKAAAKLKSDETSGSGDDTTTDDSSTSGS